MKNLTTFLNLIETKGHAELIQETDKENLFLVLEMKIDNKGNIGIAAYYEEFDSKIDIKDANDVIKYQFGKLAEETEYRVGFIPGYDIKSVLSTVIASNFTNKKTVFTTADKSEELKNKAALEYLYNISIRLLSISNHNLVCSHCTNDDYLAKYLLESENTNTESFEEVTIEDVEKYEDKLIERFNIIKETGEQLSSKEIDHDTYTKTAYQWIDLYDDRKALNLKM